MRIQRRLLQRRRPHIFYEASNVSFFVLVYNCFLWAVSFVECSLCFYLVVRPPGFVDGHPAKMSRDYILYLKGLCLGSSSHCFSFLLLCCSVFVLLVSLVLFCG
jgi:hypothetical protein